jgi:DNA invertase Pin-like site-specific DNA recombinase
MGAFAEFERSLIRERQKEGIAIAKSKGLYRGRKPKLSSEQIIELKNKITLGIPKAKVVRQFQISRATLYSLLS